MREEIDDEEGEVNMENSTNTTTTISHQMEANSLSVCFVEQQDTAVFYDL
jgi:hypothetical protein